MTSSSTDWLSFVPGWLDQLTNPKEESMHPMHPEGLCFAVGYPSSYNNKLGAWETVTVSSRQSTENNTFRHGDEGNMHMYRLSDNSLVICNNVHFGSLEGGVMPPDMLCGHEIDIEKFMINLIRYPNEEHIVQKYIGRIILSHPPIESLNWYTDIQSALYDPENEKNIDHPFLISRDDVDVTKTVLHQYTVLRNTETIEFRKKNIHACEVLTCFQPLRFYMDLELKRDKDAALFDSTKTDDMIKEAIDHVYDTIEYHWPKLFKEFRDDFKNHTMKPVILKKPNETTVKSARVIFPQIILRGPQNVTDLQVIIKQYKNYMNKIPHLLIQTTTGDYKNMKAECLLPFQTEYNKDNKDIKTLQDGHGLVCNTTFIKNACVGIYGENDVTVTPFGNLKVILREIGM